MRGFQIWPQNSSQNNLTLLLATNLSKIGNIPNMAIFDSFWVKMGQMLLDSHFDVRFGILSSFSMSWDPICYYFHILNISLSMLGKTGELRPSGNTVHPVISQNENPRCSAVFFVGDTTTCACGEWALRFSVLFPLFRMISRSTCDFVVTFLIRNIWCLSH